MYIDELETKFPYNNIDETHELGNFLFSLCTFRFACICNLYLQIKVGICLHQLWLDTSNVSEFFAYLAHTRFACLPPVLWPPCTFFSFIRSLSLLNPSTWCIWRISMEIKIHVKFTSFLAFNTSRFVVGLEIFGFSGQCVFLLLSFSWYFACISHFPCSLAKFGHVNNNRWHVLLFMYVSFLRDLWSACTIQECFEYLHFIPLIYFITCLYYIFMAIKPNVSSFSF